MKGLRASLAITEAPGGEWLELTFENTSGKYMYLPLGRIGSGRLDAVWLTISQDGKPESNLVFRSTEGIAPSRSEPVIVPLLAGSRYTWRTPLRSWNLPAGSQGPSVLRAYLLVGVNEATRYLNCFGLQIFWTGQLVSNPAPLPVRAR